MSHETGSDKNPVGRPTKYKPEYCAQLVSFMAKGFSYEAFAGSISVEVKTLYNWEQDFPEFLQAKSEAFGKNRVFWEEKGIYGLAQHAGGTNLNSTVWIFNMKNRFPKEWRDRKELEHAIEPESIRGFSDIVRILKAVDEEDHESE